MQYPTIMHLWYCVTAKTDCTITSSSGLRVNLSAGTQYFVYADADALDITGEATLTQTPARFSPAPVAVPGGGGSPVPIPLSADSVLQHGHLYTAAFGEEAQVLSALTMAPYATAEIRLDMTADSPVIWPPAYWLDGSSRDGGDHNVPPDMPHDKDAEGAAVIGGMRYYIVMREAGGLLLARVAFSHPLKPEES